MEGTRWVDSVEGRDGAGGTQLLLWVPPTSNQFRFLRPTLVQLCHLHFRFPFRILRYRSRLSLSLSLNFQINPLFFSLICFSFFFFFFWRIDFWYSRWWTFIQSIYIAVHALSSQQLYHQLCVWFIFFLFCFCEFFNFILMMMVLFVICYYERGFDVWK